ncbi:sulfurtransferase complex subunit TusD [Cobetia amphilecti]|uniref:sulfurtransferase complex subunit TusD n=1 Tax=Cobetia amphilecti TaxID=1055104 RepID=UPI002549DE7D|nr:sulfurtransferase complex subunit TusD [Cobetia amphilecti]
MRYALAVYGGPYSQQASHSALRFADALLARGHQLTTVFFYHDGVYNAANMMAPPQDEPHLRDRWLSLAENHAIRLQVCVAAGLRRGMLDEREAARHGKQGHTLEAPFELTGLGQLVEATLDNDHLITFA